MSGLTYSRNFRNTGPYSPSNPTRYTVNPSLKDIMNEAAKQYTDENGGSVQAISGQRPYSGTTTNHPFGTAMDVSITDAQGNKLDNEPGYKNQQTFRDYEKLMQNAKAVQTITHPEFNKTFRAGMNFGGKSHTDKMHADVNPQYGGVTAWGGWANGLNATGRRNLPNAVSVGMNQQPDLVPMAAYHMSPEMASPRAQAGDSIDRMRERYGIIHGDIAPQAPYAPQEPSFLSKVGSAIEAPFGAAATGISHLFSGSPRPPQPQPIAAPVPQSLPQPTAPSPFTGQPAGVGSLGAPAPFGMPAQASMAPSPQGIGGLTSPSPAGGQQTISTAPAPFSMPSRPASMTPGETGVLGLARSAPWGSAPAPAQPQQAPAPATPPSLFGGVPSLTGNPAQLAPQLQGFQGAPTPSSPAPVNGSGPYMASDLRNMDASEQARMQQAANFSPVSAPFRSIPDGPMPTLTGVTGPVTSWDPAHPPQPTSMPQLSPADATRLATQPPSPVQRALQGVGDVPGVYSGTPQPANGPLSPGVPSVRQALQGVQGQAAPAPVGPARWHAPQTVFGTPAAPAPTVQAPFSAPQLSAVDQSSPYTTRSIAPAPTPPAPVTNQAPAPPPTPSPDAATQLAGMRAVPGALAGAARAVGTAFSPLAGLAPSPVMNAPPPSTVSPIDPQTPTTQPPEMNTGFDSTPAPTTMQQAKTAIGAGAKVARAGLAGLKGGGVVAGPAGALVGGALGVGAGLAGLAMNHYHTDMNQLFGGPVARPGSAPATQADVVANAAPSVLSQVNRNDYGPAPSGYHYGYSPFGHNISAISNNASEASQIAGTGPGILGAFGFGTSNDGYNNGPSNSVAAQQAASKVADAANAATKSKQQQAAATQDNNSANGTKGKSGGGNTSGPTGGGQNKDKTYTGTGGLY